MYPKEVAKATIISAAHTSTPIEISLFGADSHLSKTIRLTDDGLLEKGDPGHNPTACMRHFVKSAADLAGLIQGMTPNHALALGVMRDDMPLNEEGYHTISVAAVDPKTARTKDNFLFRAGQPAWMLFDRDGPGPDFEEVFVELIDIARVKRASTSAGLHRAGLPNHRMGGSQGMHMYVAVMDGADIPRATKVAHERCWLAGHGRWELAADGKLLDRSLIDVAVASPERLVYEGAPVLVGLEQDAEARRPIAIEGELLDTRAAFPDLTPDEVGRLAEIKEAARVATQPASDAQRATYRAARIAELVASGLSPEAAEQRVAEYEEAGSLSHEHVLHFARLGTATVAQVLADPDKYHGQDLADPVEGTGYGRTTAKIYLKQNRRKINSMAHGGRLYSLPDRTAAEMFSNLGTTQVSNVVQINGPLPGNASAMMSSRGSMLVVARPILEALPILPREPHHAVLPAIGLHGDAAADELHALLSDRIPWIVATRDVKGWAAWWQAHPASCEAAMGKAPGEVDSFTRFLESKIVKHIKFSSGSWMTHPKTGEIDPRKPINFELFQNMAGFELRHNDWLRRGEIKGGQWTDWTEIGNIEHAIVSRMTDDANIHFGDGMLWKRFETYAHDNIINPVLDHINQCALDYPADQGLLATWLPRVLGVPETDYTKGVSRIIALGLVGRALQPGIKFDLMLLLISTTQGFGKQKFFKQLALKSEWFLDEIDITANAKECIEQLPGKLVAECAEFKNAHDLDAAKAMLTKCSDKAREAYGRKAVERPRSNIFGGSANHAMPLSDITGNRRFLPIKLAKHIDNDAMDQCISRVVGAAVHEFRGMGKVTEIALPKGLWEVAAAEQDSHRSRGTLEILLEEGLGDKSGPDCYVRAAALAKWRQDQGTKVSDNGFSAIMARLGFEQTRPTITGVRTRVWQRGEFRAEAQATITEQGKFILPLTVSNVVQLGPIAEAKAAYRMRKSLPPLPGR